MPMVQLYNDRRPIFVANDAHEISMPAALALESVQVLVDTLMDKWPTATMESGYDHIPKAFRDEPAKLDAEEQVFELQRAAVVNMIDEIVKNADIVGHGENGDTLYLLQLSPTNADTLAALYADLEDGDPLDAGEYDPLDKGELDELDRGEDEHDGREPDPEDVG